MNVNVKNKNGETLLLVTGGVLVYLWFKGAATTPALPATPTAGDYAENTYTRVKNGYAATLAEFFPDKTTASTTPVVLPTTTPAAPVQTQQSCLSGIGSISNEYGIYTPAKGDDAGTVAVKTNSSNILPVSPRQIAAQAVTAASPVKTNIC